MKVIVKSETARRDEFKNKETGEITVRWKQQCALDAGGDFPLPFDISIEDGKAYPVGEYTFSPDTFKAGRFGGLEFNNFNMKLVSLSKVKAVANG